MKEIYNYKVMWNSPFKIYRLKPFPAFRNGLKLVTALIFVFIYLIFYILNNILPITSYLGAFYYAVPFLITYYIANNYYDGKGVFTYAYDMLEYKYYKHTKVNVLANDQVMIYRDKKVKFI